MLSVSIETIRWFLSLILFMSCIMFTDSCMLNNPCSSEMKLSWSWCMAILMLFNSIFNCLIENFIYSFVFRDRISLCSSGWLQTHSIMTAGIIGLHHQCPADDFCMYVHQGIFLLHLFQVLVWIILYRMNLKEFLSFLPYLWRVSSYFFMF